MDQFAEDEVEYATINRSHNTLSTPVVTELKNKFQYEIQDSSSSEETSDDDDGTETDGSGSTVESGSTIGEEEEESSDEDNNKDEDAVSIGSAASLLDFSDINRERRVTNALNEGANADTMSVCSTDVADIVQRQLAEFSMTLRRQIENDMQSIINKQISATADYGGSQPALPPPTPSRKKHLRAKSEDGLNTKRKVNGHHKCLGF